MSVKLLVGAVVGAVSVWGAAWKVASRREESVALAAPERVEARVARAREPLECPQPGRSEVCDLEPSTASGGLVPEVTLTQREIAALIEDLHDDEIRGNARSAMRALGKAGPEVLVPLEAALRSNDYQQRQFAGALLAARNDAPATQALANVLVEGLGDDLPPDSTCARSPIDVNCVIDLNEHCRHVLSTRPALFQRALPRLASLLDSSNPALRFDVARICATQRSEVARGRVLGELLVHLEDNQDDTDARIALPAIAGYGVDALPLLERHWPGRDAQQRALLGHLIWLCAPTSPCAHELDAAGFHALGFVPWKPLPLEPGGQVD